MTPLVSFGQRVSTNEEATVPTPNDPVVASYNGTWNRLGVLGQGNFGFVYCDQHTETWKVQTVKEIRKGQRESIIWETKCMIRLGAVHPSFHCRTGHW